MASEARNELGKEGESLKFQFVVYPQKVGVIRLFGELDHHETEKVRRELSETIMQGQIDTLIWNLEHLKFMDSSGIGLVLGRNRELEVVNGQMVILNPSSTVKKIFTFAGLLGNVAYNTEEQAVLEARGIRHG